jgi:Xaa-Pro aminopeptidase
VKLSSNPTQLADNQKTARARLKLLRQKMDEQRLDSLLVSALPNVRYLTGFTGSSGALLLTPGHTVFFTDSRYDLQSHAEVKTAKVRIVKGDALMAAVRWGVSQDLGRTGFDAGTLSVAQHGRIKEILKGSGNRKAAIKLLATPNLVENLRMVKDAGEIGLLRRAVQLGSRCFEETLPLLKAGVREFDLAAEIEYRMRLYGGEKPAFETIIAFGDRTALPHAHPTDRRLKANEFVLFDLGVILSGYCSDMTRTVFWGKASTKARKMYNAVLDAQLASEHAVRAGLTCGETDRAARRVLDKQGYGRYFTHSTGHGLGLEIHENPRVAAKQTTVLKEGMAITIEPGVYIPGVGGVRIEDVVIVRKDHGEVLTQTPKQLLEI